MQFIKELFPNTAGPVMTLNLERKTRGIPKGRYGFLEYYCTDPVCDCRRVVLLVLNEKMKEKATICFGFDQKGPADGPYLQSSAKQSPYALQLLEFFVECLNSDSHWLDRMYRQYRAVRELVDGKRYRGKAFPKPGTLTYRVLPPPDLEELIEKSLQKLESFRSAPPAGGGEGGRRPGGSRRAGQAARNAVRALGGWASLLEGYLGLGEGPQAVAEHALLQEELRHYLLENEAAEDELAKLLPALCQLSPEDDERIEAALRLLLDALDTLRIEQERRRPGADLRMERLQGALARRVFLENEDLDLCAAVSHVLFQSRVEILPVLREAHSRMMESGAGRSDLVEDPGEEMMAGIARSLEKMGLATPFDGVDALLQLIALNEAEVQTALLAEMLEAESALLRELSALMLFHPDARVRQGVSGVLATLDGSGIGSETLRRLIVVRNWFPEELRRNIDQAVSNARRARVECAPLVKPPAMTVYASTIDGAGAQSFQVVVPDGKSFFSCSILLKQEVGVADAFVVPLEDKRELNKFLGMLKEEASFIETGREHLDLRVCQALADGVASGNAPSYWLLRIAELLGCDRWQAQPLDPHRELLQLREYMESLFPKLLDEREYRSALEDSAEWQASEPMLSSWFEDDDNLDREIEASRGKRKSLEPAAAIDRIRERVLEKRRGVWLERLVVTTLWLKSSKRAPVPWYRMFHVAQAVADASVPLREIPLMTGVALSSYQAYLQRSQRGRGNAGARR